MSLLRREERGGVCMAVLVYAPHPGPLSVSPSGRFKRGSPMGRAA